MSISSVGIGAVDYIFHPTIIGLTAFVFGRYDFFNISGYTGGTLGIPVACAVGAGIATLVMESGIWSGGLSAGISGSTSSLLTVSGGSFMFAMVYGLITSNPVSMGTAVAGGVGAFIGSGGWHKLKAKLGM